MTLKKIFNNNLYQKKLVLNKIKNNNKEQKTIYLMPKKFYRKT